MTKTGRVLALYLWPVVLIIRLVHYAFKDDPPHLLLWQAGRTAHAIMYLAVAGLVAVSIKETPVFWLTIKAYIVTSLALTSALADLFYDRPWSRAVSTSLTWVLIAIANLTIVMGRLAYALKDGKA